MSDWMSVFRWTCFWQESSIFCLIKFPLGGSVSRLLISWPFSQPLIASVHLSIDLRWSILLLSSFFSFIFFTDLLVFSVSSDLVPFSSVAILSCCQINRDCGFSVVSLLIKEKVICSALMRHSIFLSAFQQLSWWQLSVPSECFYHIDDVCEEKIFSKIKDGFSVQMKRRTTMCQERLAWKKNIDYRRL